LVRLVEQMMENFSSAFVPLSWAVDVVPQLRYLPEWLPGMGYKKVARAWYRLNRAVWDTPFSLVQRQMAVGANRPSYVSSLLAKLADNTDGKLSRRDENMIKETAAILYGGGADTTISTLNSFILAMLLFPDVQRKAQKEIDDVIGTGRLPQFEDHGNLPYVSALVKESLRWFPVLPVATTHVVDAELTYEGFQIPKGAYLVTSIWWLLHDPDVYAEPSSFDPSRFLESRDEPDPAKHAFGYGRRICPGRFLAMESLYITISRFLAVFDITRAVDDEGRELEIKVEPTAGLISHPTPYPFVIKVRSAAHEELIRSIEIDHPWEASDAQYLDADELEI
jgi:fumagillin biosynthesis cytochrome P450 monooxygenase